MRDKPESETDKGILIAIHDSIKAKCPDHTVDAKSTHANVRCRHCILVPNNATGTDSAEQLGVGVKTIIDGAKIQKLLDQDQDDDKRAVDEACALTRRLDVDCFRVHGSANVERPRAPCALSLFVVCITTVTFAIK